MGSVFIIAIATSILGAALAWLAVYDAKHLRLPDIVTLPLIGIGFIVTFVLWGTSALPASVLAAALGFLSLWAVATLYRRWRGWSGLGLGDAKLLAAAGAWLGPWLLAPTVFFGAVLAFLYVGTLRLRGLSISSRTAIPFGPFLSAAFFGLWCLRAAGVVT
jgi:prepilin signal peptidase PulO-like enzyme (type II secretory pathway)